MYEAASLLACGNPWALLCTMANLLAAWSALTGRSDRGVHIHETSMNVHENTRSLKRPGVLFLVQSRSLVKKEAT